MLPALSKRDALFYVLLPALLFLWLGFTVFPDFEIFYDEFFETRMASDNVALFLSYISGEPVPKPYDRIYFNLEYYGTFFNLLAYAVQSAIAPGADILSFERLEAKRYVIFASAFFAAVVVAIAICRVTRSRYSAWLAFGITALMPYYVQHIFTNPKDVPFAAMMTIAGMVCARCIACALPMTQRFGRRQVFWLFAAGIAIGLCASVRIAGLAVFGFWGLAWIICGILQGALNIRRLCLAASIVAVIAVLMLWALHPVAYFQPLTWFKDAWQYHFYHPHRAWTLTDGEVLYSLETPWYYLPKWFFVKIPLLWQLLCAAGIVYAFASIRRQSAYIQALHLLFLLQLVWIPLAAVIGQINLYHMGRQFLFIYPAMVYFCAIAIIRIIEYPPRYRVPALILTAFLMVKIAWDMVLLHPQHEAYFVEPVRTDIHTRWGYFGYLMEGLQWVADNAEDNANVLVNTDRSRVSGFARFYVTPDMRIFSAKDKVPRPFYIVGFGQDSLSSEHIGAKCELRYQSKRPLGPSTLIFSSVRYCP